MKLLALCVLGSALVACTKQVRTSPASGPLSPDPVVANSSVPLPDSAVAKSVPDSTMPRPMDWSDSLDAIEVAGIAASGGKVSRASFWELRIQLLNGRTLVLKTDSTMGMVLRYAGHLREIHSHVVHRVPYEDTGNYLVVDDSTGDSTIVWAMPVPSPDGTRFALTSLGQDAESNVGNISVWRMVGRKPQKEFSIDNEAWESSDAVWRDSATIDFTRNTSPDPNDPFRYIKTPARLTRTGTAWALSKSRVF